MEFVNQSVVHVKFGGGKIKGREGNAITIYFDAYGARTFLYPQSFEKHLKASDPEFAKAIAADLDKEWEEQSNRELALRRQVEEMAKQAKQERMIVKKAPKSAAGKSKKKPPQISKGV